MSPTPARARRHALPTGGLALTALLLGACGGGGSDGPTLGTLSIDAALPPTTIRGMDLAGVLSTPAPLPLALDVESTEAYRIGEYASVNSIAIDGLSLTVLSPASEDADRDLYENGMPDDLSFLSAVRVFVVATIDGVRQPAIPIGGTAADALPLAPGTRTLRIDTTGIDVRRYVQADGGFELGLEIEGDAPPDDVVFDGRITYRVGAGFR